VEAEAEASVTGKSSESESQSLSESATCFPSLETEDGGSNAPVGSVLITLATRYNRAVRDVAGSERYQGGTKAVRFTRCTFASTPRAVAICVIDGDKTEAAASGRLADR